MGIRHNRVLRVKISLLLVMLLVVTGGLTGLGCIQGLQPIGWSGVEVTDGSLFVGSEEGRLVAVNIADGSHQWSEPLKMPKQAGGFGCAAPAGGGGCAAAPAGVAIYGTPAVAGDLVYIGGYNGKIYAFDSSSLAIRWIYPREGNLQPIVGGAVVALGRVYISSSEGKVYALDAATGNKQWEFQAGDKIWSTPAIEGDTLYIGSFDKKLYALDATDGSKKWEFTTGGGIASTLLIDDNTVYIGPFDRHLYAVDATNGSLRWRTESEAGSWFWAKPIVYNNTIYAGNLDGKIYILNAENGAKIAEFDLGSPVSSSPVLVDSSIIIASEEGRVYALDTSRNQIKQLTDLKERVNAPLSASDGVVYVHTQKEDTLYALNAQTGARLWSIPLSSE
ncbi:Outer membrane protein assembly factor BamB [subsurface metagenome]